MKFRLMFATTHQVEHKKFGSRHAEVSVEHPFPNKNKQRSLGQYFCLFCVSCTLVTHVYVEHTCDIPSQQLVESTQKDFYHALVHTCSLLAAEPTSERPEIQHTYMPGYMYGRMQAMRVVSACNFSIYFPHALPIRAI